MIILSIASLITLYFEIQLVYNSIFGEFMSVWQIAFGAQVAINFGRQMMYGISQTIIPIIALLLPLAAMYFAVLKNKIVFKKQDWKISASAAAVIIILHFLTVGVMKLNDNNAFSTYNLYTNPNTGTNISVKNIGLLSTTRLECKFLVFNDQAVLGEDEEYSSDNEKFVPDESEMVKYNMIDIDFDALAGTAADDKLIALDDFFSRRSPTSKHKYTGLFKDYNLITICAESYSPFLIDKERTPALYELSTNGFVFNNYFGSYGSNTTNGEYTLCLGIYPDLFRSKSTASFYASQNNYLPFCLGNEFKALGAETWAYHNYTGEYYSRNVTHPNMGYTFKSATDGLDIELSWPSSDLDMMIASVDDYIDTGKQFCAYYMTFSGHYQYNWENPMSAKNRDITEDLPYCDTVKAFIACNQELEYALEYLMQRLEQAGIADKTVIVLTNDHYPYGLTADEYNELAGYEVDTTFDKFRSSFICYVPGMSVPVDTYCSTVDILPTILNLFGIEYDSRLLIGRDVLSPEAHGYAVLSDQSFITEDFGFDTSIGEAVYFSDIDVDETQDRMAEIQKEIATDFLVSKEILESDYYSHALLGAVSVKDPIEDYAFTDIPNTFSLGALKYVYDNGYMEPMSETQFGFSTQCTYAELLDILYKINGSPNVGHVESVTMGSEKSVSGKYAPAVYWAKKNGLLNGSQENMDSFTLLTRKNCSVSLYKFAALQGLDTGVDSARLAEYIRAYPELTALEAKAILWCFDNEVMRAAGSSDSAFKQARNIMSRQNVVNAVYNFYLYVAG
ncbi:MAG: LTA synthase family protein [Oscillospiraceae bacterium]|nr:LTA synthase family protein [Oscillospiraceae bacterium]